MSSLVIAAPEQGHDALAAFLGQMRVNALICGDIGGGARKALEEVGVILYGGVAGSADTAVNAFLAGTLGYDPDVHCRHHEHGGDHGCGGHDCRGAKLFVQLHHPGRQNVGLLVGTVPLSIKMQKYTAGMYGKIL